MKKIIFTIAFLPLFAFAGWGQDLLSNTISGRSPAQVPAEPNTIARLIEDQHLQSQNNIPASTVQTTSVDSDCTSSQCNCDECTDCTIVGNPIPSGVYSASNSISSPGVANATADNNVVFQAGNYIELTPGFIATELFVAEIISCGDGADRGSFADLRLGAAPSGSPGEALHLYPNPASTRLHLAYRLEQEGEVALHFANQYGQVVRMEERAFQVRGEHTREIELTGWPAGLYYAVLRTAGGSQVKAFVVASP
jgi:hypothetical protein